MAITKLNYGMSHAKHGHFKTASKKYELGGRPAYADSAEATFLVAWAVIVRDYYEQDNPQFSQIKPKLNICSKPPMETGPDDIRSQEWIFQIEADLTGKDALSYVSRKMERKYCCSHSEMSGPTGVFIRNYSNPREQRHFNERSQVLKQVQFEIILLVEIFQESTIFDIYINSQKRPEYQPGAVLESFSRVCREIAFKPEAKLCQLNTLGSLDSKKVFQLNARGANKIPTTPETLHSLIGKNYDSRPNDISLLSTETHMTYSELGEQSAAVSQLLTLKGVKAGDYVAFCMEKTIFSIVAVVGILRTGAVYVPMDVFHPTGRIAQIVEEAEIQYVVTDQVMRHKFDGLPVALIMPVQSEQNEIPENWAAETNPDPSNPVYVMFTSGSTGSPKGVIHEHAAVSQSLLDCLEDLKIDSSTRFMQSASLAFDASIMEVFAPLVAGGCLCMPSQDERNGDLESAMQKMGVTDAWLTPGLTAQIKPQSLSDLRTLSVGGEPPSAETLAVWAPRVKFNNLYGVTEAGVWDTVKVAMKAHDNPKNIGRGIGSVACWIVDPENVQKLRPFGAEGELLIQSPYLAKGYLKDPEKEASSFLDSSSLNWRPMIHAKNGSRLYRTGDLAKFNENGELIFLGRQTGFIKIRGLRVDLGEVETAINSNIQQGRSAVVVLDADPSNIEIVAFVETESHPRNGLADEMHGHLVETLPSYMIPSIFIPLKSLPLTASKKLDRQTLKVQLSKMGQRDLLSFRKGGFEDVAYEPIPETRPTALDLSFVISDMLKCKDEGYAMSLGGHNFPLDAVGLTSIHFVSLLNTIRKKYGKSIKIQDVRQASMSVYDLENLVINDQSQVPAKTDQRDLLANLKELLSTMPLVHVRGKTLFLTSITGFLGSQILRQLLETSEVDHIIALVRGETLEVARNRVQEQAEIGKWWRDEFHDRIEIWLGDLNKPQLGLDKSNWSRLFADGKQRKVDGIIHNGAKVNWMDNYENLEKTNVHSTAHILSGMATMSNPFPLVYVSGGYMPAEEETHQEIAKSLSDACGYDQTKFMSELLINEYNQHLELANPIAPRARTIIPGFIVGTQKEGIAHTEDFLWRFAFSISRLQAISKDFGHLTVAGVDQVSDLVSKIILRPRDYPVETIRLFDGVSTPTMCRVLAEKLNIKIRPMEHKEWMKLLREDVEAADFDHPFAPVLAWFEESVWQFMDGQTNTWKNKFYNEEDILKSLKSSVGYLKNLGYFVDGGLGANAENAAIFTRTK
ncbi:hypothetical protein N7478_011030 [Penicillium angulare]|uniref:uncharacterized protein n=1 Tax=Penicillium angulare TaxID=116970 RepID=UPI0025418C16|nr:uncharacterized protein N7478_011030 [Penicillium angulare]KAJ5263425.1 hypothetical protein N7478_011030 [Penicillium angulare]